MTAEQQLSLAQLALSTSGDPNYIRFLHDTAAAVGPLVVAEMGTYRGASAAAFALAAPSAEVYTIDNGRSGVSEMEVNATMERLGAGNVRVLRDDSWNIGFYVRERSVDLAYIDADHSYEAAKADYEAMLPLMADRGVIILDDLNLGEGVEQVFNEAMKDFEAHETFPYHNGFGVLGPEREVEMIFEAAP